MDTAMDVMRLSAATAVQVAEDEPAAIASLEAQVRRLEEAGYVEDMIWSLRDLGSAHRRQGNRDVAIDVLTRAAELAHDGGETLLARLADRDLRELGVRAWRRTATRSRPDHDTLAPLSGREREVAGLVASGASNREIAEALVVSPKTIERHLTNILAKLDIRNRTELANLVHSAAGTGFPR
jgi:ATP/maltotriose-dependent transcriptional regulator MalT